MARRNRFYNPGAADIVGSLDTRHQSGRYSRVDAITPNVDITNEGAAATKKVFAPITPTHPVEREEISRRAFHEADLVAGTIDGSAEGSRVPVEGLRTLDDEVSDKVAEKLQKIEEIGEQARAEVAALDAPESIDEAPVEEAVVVEVDEDEAIDEGDDDEASDEGSDGESDAEAEASSSEPLPDGWKTLTVVELTELASARGVEVKTSDKKAQIIAKLQQWEDAQS